MEQAHGQPRARTPDIIPALVSAKQDCNTVRTIQASRCSPSRLPLSSAATSRLVAPTPCDKQVRGRLGCTGKRTWKIKTAAQLQDHVHGAAGLHIVVGQIALVAHLLAAVDEADLLDLDPLLLLKGLLDVPHGVVRFEVEVRLPAREGLDEDLHLATGRCVGLRAAALPIPCCTPDKRYPAKWEALE
eukprot:CAMPEP_0183431614 /NCGR_PEP_ID=MMETSP0370-20130417/54937_1 /TAXON_ID=268820 /ORGANISM="Peridinium aciculiferum, Strain PAER-2" /LENGTH=186 /DNA_ID=CAMNT_0025617345 /DNA_START=105 /DNA_END=663 /DNA_ORIENTATION=+